MHGEMQVKALSEEFEKIDHLIYEAKLDPAKQALLDILYDDPDCEDALFRLGIVYTESGDQDAAMKTLLFHNKLNSANADAWEALGCAYYRKGNMKDAGKSFSVALSLDPENPSVLRNLAVIAGKDGDYEKSYILLKKSARLNSRDYLTLYALSNTCIDTARYKEARRILEELLKLEIPQDIRHFAEINLLTVKLKT